MEILKNYTPANIEFMVADEKNLEMPAELFAEYKTENEKLTMLKDNFGHVWSKHSKGMEVNRKLDDYEKRQLREEYNYEIEEMLPKHESNFTVRKSEVDQEIATLKALVSATMTKIRDLSSQVAKGTVKHYLSAEATHRIANYDAKKYFFYAFIDGKLKLVHIEPIPESECQKWYNAMPALIKQSAN